MSLAKKLLKDINEKIYIEETYNVDKTIYLPNNKTFTQGVTYTFETEKDLDTFLATLSDSLKAKFRYIGKNDISNGGKPHTSLTTVGWTGPQGTNYSSFEKDAGLNVKNTREENF